MAKKPEILRVIENHRDALDRGGRATSSRLVDEYARAWKSMNVELEKLVQVIADAQAAGQPISPAWLAREQRYKVLLSEVEDQIDQFAQYAYKRVQRAQADVIAVAQKNATSFVGSAAQKQGIAVAFNKLPVETVKTILATTGPRSPLQAVFSSMGSNTAKAVSNALVEGVIRGQNPRVVARTIRRITGAPLARTLTIARTEMLRAYREASRATYQQHGDIVEGWIWYSALDARGCVACWAKHGSVHPVSESMSAHPNCRCAMVPYVPGWSPAIAPGAEEFSKLTTDQQEAILGPAKYRAFKDGAVAFDNFVKETHSPVWGACSTERSLVDVLGPTRAGEYYRSRA